MKICERIFSLMLCFVLLLGSTGCTSDKNSDFVNIIDGYEFLFDESILNQNGMEEITAEMLVDLYETYIPVEYASKGDLIKVEYDGRIFNLTAGLTYTVPGSPDIRVVAYHKEYHPTILGRLENYMYAVVNLATGTVYETYNISGFETNIGEYRTPEVLIANAKAFMLSHGVDVEGFECKYSTQNDIKKVFEEGNKYDYSSSLAHTVFFIEYVCGLPTPNVFYIRATPDGVIGNFCIESMEHCGRFPNGVQLDMEAYLKALNKLIYEISDCKDYDYWLKLTHRVVKDVEGAPLLETYVERALIKNGGEKSFYVYTPLEIAE